MQDFRAAPQPNLVINMQAQMIFGAALAAALALAAPASAMVVVNIWETPGGVEMAASGALDITGLSSAGSQNVNLTGVVSSAGAFSFVLGLSDRYLSATTLAVAFGSGGLVAATASSGDIFVVQGPSLNLTPGYVSGDPLASAMSFAGQSFVSMGMSAGSYLIALPADAISVMVGVAPSVPLPADAGLLAAGLAGIGLVARRRRA